MAESTLSITQTIIKSYITDFVAGNATYASNTTDTQNRILRSIKSGERRFYNAYPWSFLTPNMTLTLTAPYATGTIEVVSGVVTLSPAGTFPPWAAQGVLSVEGAYYTVASRDGNNQITLNDTSLNVSSGTSYSLLRLRYTLPDDFGGFVEPYLSYSAPTNKWCRVKLTGPGEILARRQLASHVTGQQIYEAAVTPIAGPPDSTGHRFGLMVWPPAGEAGTLTGPYYSNPNTLGTDSYYPLGGAPHAETLLEACMSAADLAFNDNVGEHERRYQECLQASIAHDQRTNAQKHLGNINRSSWSRGGRLDRHDMSNHYVTYNGSLYLG